MSDLRLLILLIGLLFIGAVFYWELRRIKKTQRDQVIHSLDDHDLPATGISPRAADYTGDAGMILNPGRDVAAGEAEHAAADAPARAREGDAIPGDVVCLHVIAGEGNTIPGGELDKLLQGLGFRYGDMKIYHHYGIDSLASHAPLFSLANMYEPGYFEPENADEFNTAGLVVFFTLPSHLDNRLVFDLMLDTTRELATGLNATVCDNRRNRLTESALTQIYSRVDEYKGR